MALIRWEPYREVETLQRQMNHLFDNLMTSDNGGSTFMPPAEIHETPEAIHLRLEVPGMDAKDIDVQVTAQAVAINGERKSQTKTTEKGVTRSEFRYGRFQRVIPLQSRIQNDKVQAEYNGGVLNLILPKAEDEKNKVVKINLA